MNGNNSELHQKLFGGNEPPKKKIPAFFIISAALLLVAIILLSVFLSSYLSVVHLRSEDGGITLIDVKKDVKYLLAPMCYEPIAYMTDVYAEYGDTEYHAVRDADPADFLCTIDMNIFDLYYADTITLPDLTRFNANYTRVCRVGEIAIMSHSIEKEGTEGIVKHFLTAETVDSSLISGVKTTLYLKFMSEDYNFMYYVITYYETNGGDRYLYDRTTGRCVALGDLFINEISGIQE